MIRTNIIYNEDCIETMKKMPIECVDCIITSPPYDNIRKYNGHSEFDFENTARYLFRILKNGGTLVWIVGDQVKEGNESGTSFKQALYFKEVGFKLADTMIYQKPIRGAYGSSLHGYYQIFEYMFIFSKGLQRTVNLLKDRKNVYTQKRPHSRIRKNDILITEKKEVTYEEYGRRSNIWYYPTGKNHTTNDDIAFEHPAVFPEKMVKDHLASWTNERDIVYDPFMGSGTTAKVCIKNNRQYVGSEINKEYYKLIERRLSKYDNKRLFD